MCLVSGALCPYAWCPLPLCPAPYARCVVHGARRLVPGDRSPAPETDETNDSDLVFSKDPLGLLQK